MKIKIIAKSVYKIIEGFDTKGMKSDFKNKFPGYRYPLNTGLSNYFKEDILLQDTIIISK